MTFLQINLTLIVGVFLLIVGAVAKKRWLLLLSVPALAIALGQLLFLYMGGRS
jgi:hypothetical protein